MEQVHEEEAKEEEVAEGEDEEEKLEVEEKEQQDLQVPPKTPRKQIQKNHPSDQIIGTKMQELRLEEEFIHQNNCT
jgi:hypothetical protein